MPCLLAPGTPREPADRPVPAPQAPRPRWHGRDLARPPGWRPGFREAGGDQADPTASRREPGVRGDVPRRGAPRGPPQPPEHRPDLRPGPRGRQLLHRHGARPRREPAHRAQAPRRARARGPARTAGRPHRRRLLPGARLRPRRHRRRGPAPERGPPGREPPEPPPRLRRPGEGRGLRHRQGGDPGGGDPHRGAQGQVQLHVAGALQGRPPRRALGPLRPGGGALGAGQRPPALQPHDRHADLHGHLQRAAAEPGRGGRRGLGVPGLGDPKGPGEGPRRPVRRWLPDGRRPRALPPGARGAGDPARPGRVDGGALRRAHRRVAHAAPGRRRRGGRGPDGRALGSLPAGDPLAVGAAGARGVGPGPRHRGHGDPARCRGTCGAGGRAGGPRGQ